MNEHSQITSWEQAVLEYCRTLDNTQAVLDNYFDEDVVEAAERFYNSVEFAETLRLLPQSAKNLLEIGAGRGIASYAYAKKGFNVTALEPDPGKFIGASAIKMLAERTSVPINIVEDFAETLPFNDESFDIVYVRQTLHHADDLEKFCSEVARVLVKNGIFIAVREHVIDKAEDLAIFLDSHPLHHRYGGEHAYTVAQYTSALKKSGMHVITVLSTYDTDINLFPSSREALKETIRQKIKIGRPEFLLNIILKAYGILIKTPGRLYSFIGRKQ
jgi:ubiquinone/menaquinone biosynthesis C-methylase UbiE